MINAYFHDYLFYLLLLDLILGLLIKYTSLIPCIIYFAVSKASVSFQLKKVRLKCGEKMKYKLFINFIVP